MCKYIILILCVTIADVSPVTPSTLAVGPTHIASNPVNTVGYLDGRKASGGTSFRKTKQKSKFASVYLVGNLLQKNYHKYLVEAAV